MNAITPAKQIPPDHSTAASGTLPTEQTKLRTAISGPTRTFSIVRTRARRVGDEEAVEEVVAEQADEAGEQEADRDLLPEHLPVAAEVVGDVGPGVERGAAARARAARSPRRVVLVAGVGLPGRARAPRCLEPRRDEQPQQHRHQRDQDDAADELGERELPADQHPEDQARAPRPGWSRRTGRRAPSPPRRPSGTATWRSRSPRRSTTRRRRRGRSPRRSGARRCPRSARLDPLARDPGLHDRGDREAEHQRPPDLVGHQDCVRQPVEKRREDVAHGRRVYTLWGYRPLVGVTRVANVFSPAIVKDLVALDEAVAPPQLGLSLTPALGVGTRR